VVEAVIKSEIKGVAFQNIAPDVVIQVNNLVNNLLAQIDGHII
jgi:hypothetical protein